MRILKSAVMIITSFCFLLFTSCFNHPFVNPFDPLYAPVDGITGNAPVFTPAEGFYPLGLSITVACDDATADIYISMNGEMPEIISDNLYSGPIDIDDKTTLKAIAISSEQQVSLAAEGIFGILQPPSGFATQNVASRLVNNLSWNSAEGHDGFIIERKTGAGGTYQEIADLGPETLSYVDYVPDTGTDYYYRISSYNLNGSSIKSGAETASTGVETWVKASSTSFTSFQDLKIADLNGDGYQDILVGNQNTISWLENDGDKTFTERTLGTANNVRSIDAADIDNDGDMDVLSASFLFSSFEALLWWENTNGDGSSWNSSAIDDPSASIYYATKVKIADIDSDGDSDIIAVGFNPSGLYWWENTNGGSSWNPQLINGNSNYNGCDDLEVADIDGDGYPDVVMVNDHNIYKWMNQDGDGTNWTGQHITDASSITSVAAADIDGDNDNDLILGDDVANSIWWKENISGGSSWTNHTIDNSFAAASVGGPQDVTAADLDNDGDIDVLGNGAFRNITDFWWENNGGDGTFINHGVVVSGHTSIIQGDAVEVADMDNDGDLDTIINQNNDIEVFWMVF